MGDRTAFPWCPATRWQRDDRGEATVWHVTVQDPSAAPAWMHAVHGKGGTPPDALASLLAVVAWWLDYDARRGGTAAEVYADLHAGRAIVCGRRGRLARGGPILPPGREHVPF